uniref:Uncharacterized protein n=1 Tax=Panagrolaimus superbus TaxID=310955 RepID=A0A914Z912_9BILA
MANLSTPWVMIILSPEMLKGVKVVLRLSKDTEESRIFHIREPKTLPSNSISANALPTIATKPIVHIRL